MQPVSKAMLSICFLSLMACQPSKKDMKASFEKSCNQSGDQQFTDPKARQMFHEYCSCAAEQAVNKFTVAEWQELDKMKKDGREEAVKAKLTPVLQPCLDELTKKMSEQQPVLAH